MNDPTPDSPDASQPLSADEARLSDLLDDRLPADEAEALRARVETEPSLRAVWDGLQRVRAWTRGYGKASAALEPPPDFAAQVRRRTTAETAAETAARPSSGPPSFDLSSSDVPPGDGRRAGRLLRIMAVSYAVAALLVVGFTVHWVFDQDDRGASTPVAVDGASSDNTGGSESVPEKRLLARLSPEEEEEEEVRAASERLRLASQLKKEDRAKDASGSASETSAEEDPADSKKAKVSEVWGRDEAKSRRARPGGKRVDGQPPGGGRFGRPGGAIPPGLRDAPEEGKAPQEGNAPQEDNARSEPGVEPAPPVADKAAGDGLSESGGPAEAAPAGQPRPRAGGSKSAGRSARRKGRVRAPGASPASAGPSSAPSTAAAPGGVAPGGGALDGVAVGGAASALRRQLTAAGRAGERVFVVEAADVRVGLREARRLFDAAQLPPTRSDDDDADGKPGRDAGEADREARSSGGEKRAGGRAPRPAPAPAKKAAPVQLRFYAVDAAGLGAAAYGGLRSEGPAKEGPAKEGLGALGDLAGLELIGSVGRQVSGPALLRLQALASKGQSAGPAPAPSPRPAPTAPAPTISGPAPRTPGAVPATPSSPGLAGRVGKTPAAPAAKRTAVRILVLRRK